MISPTININRTQYQILLILLALLPEALFQASLYPLAPFIVRHVLGIHPDAVDDTVGYYTGLVNTCYFFPLFAMNILWGHLSDRWGRKPIFLLGLAAGGISALMIGLSSSIEMVLIARTLGGIFGANLSIGKSSIGDLTINDESARSWGFTLFGCLYGFAGIIGPLFGGMLSFPSRMIPSLGGNLILDEYPFLIPCLAIFILSIVSSVSTSFLLVEPTKFRPDYAITSTDPDMNEIDVDEDSETSNAESPLEPHKLRSVYLSTFKNALWPIILYCFIAYMSMHYSTSVPLYLSSPRGSFGLGMGTQQTSLVMTLFSASKLTSQIFLSSWLLRITGNAVILYMQVMSLLVFVLLAFPLASFLPSLWALILSCVMTWLIGLTDAMAFLAVNILVTNAGTSQTLGIVHGLATTLSALMRAISSTTAGALWQLGAVLHTPAVVFLYGSGLSVVAVVLSRHQQKSFKAP